MTCWNCKCSQAAAKELQQLTKALALASAHRGANQTDGAIFHDKYLKKSSRFMAHPGEAYLLNVSHPHALIPSQKGPIKRTAICMQLLDTSWSEAIDMLKETGYIDD